MDLGNLAGNEEAQKVGNGASSERQRQRQRHRQSGELRGKRGWRRHGRDGLCTAPQETSYSQSKTLAHNLI